MKRIGAFVFTLVTSMMAALPAGAQEYPPGPGGGPTVERVPDVVPRAVERGGLAVTGADLALWIGIGVALLVAGIVLLRVSRNRRATQA